MIARRQDGGSARAQHTLGWFTAIPGPHFGEIYHLSHP